MTEKKRDKFELWLDKHNHEMELFRTLFSLVAAGTGILVFLRVFGFV